MRELNDALRAAGMPEDQVNVSVDAARLQVLLEDAQDLQRRIDYDVGTEDAQQLARELRVKLAYIEAGLTLDRVAMETRNAHMGTEMIREAEAILDLCDETPDEGTTDGSP